MNPIEQQVKNYLETLAGQGVNILSKEVENEIRNVFGNIGVGIYNQVKGQISLPGLQGAPKDVDKIFGKITPPPGTPTDVADKPVDALVRILNVGLNLIMIIAGLFALFNFLMAGYIYVTAGGEPKKIQEANQKMWMTVIGLLLVVASPVIAGIIGIIAFGDWRAILQPKIYTTVGQ